MNVMRTHGDQRDREFFDKYGGCGKVSYPFGDICVCYYIPKVIKPDEEIRFEFWDTITDERLGVINALTYSDAIKLFSKQQREKV